jgi:hypothetical protein
MGTDRIIRSCGQAGRWIPTNADLATYLAQSGQSPLGDHPLPIRVKKRGRQGSSIRLWRRHEAFQFLEPVLHDDDSLRLVRASVGLTEHEEAPVGGDIK